MSNDLFLCLDTATPTARVAVLDGTGAVRHAAEATAERHSSHVLPLCDPACTAMWDRIVCVSDWQRTMFHQRLGVPD